MFFPCPLPSLKLTNRHGKSSILMVFTRKHGDFHGLLLLVSGRVNKSNKASEGPTLWSGVTLGRQSGSEGAAGSGGFFC